MRTNHLFLGELLVVSGGFTTNGWVDVHLRRFWEPGTPIVILSGPYRVFDPTDRTGSMPIAEIKLLTPGGPLGFQLQCNSIDEAPGWLMRRLRRPE